MCVSVYYGKVGVCLTSLSNKKSFVRAPLVDIVVQDFSLLQIQLKFNSNLPIYFYTTSNGERAKEETPGNYTFVFQKDDEESSIEVYGKDGDEWYPIIIRITKQNQDV